MKDLVGAEALAECCASILDSTIRVPDMANVRDAVKEGDQFNLGRHALLQSTSCGREETDREVGSYTY